MKELPILLQTERVGNLVIEQEGLYQRFSACCHPPEKRIWCVWLLGQDAVLRIGVVEPEKSGYVISRTFSNHAVDRLGELKTAVLRPAEEREKEWAPVECPEKWFRNPWLRSQIRQNKGVLAVRYRDGCELAIPYDLHRPFPLTQLFCFAGVQYIENKCYVIYRFDKRELPVLPSAGRE